MNGTGVAIWDRHPRKLQIRMIFTLLRRVPETLLHRLQYEFRKIVPPRAAPARAAEKKAIDVDASALPASPIKIPETSSVDAEQSQLLASLEAKTGQSIEMTQRAAFLDLHRSPESLYDHANPINRCAGKMFSQNGEDGIIFEIIRRLGLTGGVFAEFGVGDGRENNTLALIAAGWRGFWIGGEELVFDVNPEAASRPHFAFDKQWVTLENVIPIYKHNLGRIQETRINLISMDLDGNDIYLVEELLRQGILPDIFVVEYNAKFRPPIEFIMDYDPTHVWDGLDYFGASLTSYSKLFEKSGYFPVCCDLTGLNAFFVKNEFRSKFSDVPSELHLIYESPKYFLTGLYFSGHIMSPRTIRKIFSDLHRAHS